MKILLIAGLVFSVCGVASASDAVSQAQGCVADGNIIAATNEAGCCSQHIIRSTISCFNPDDALDQNGTLASCLAMCGTAPTKEGCIPDGGIDDVNSDTECCSGTAVPGSTVCVNPSNPNGFVTCVHTCDKTQDDDSQSQPRWYRRALGAVWHGITFWHH